MRSILEARKAIVERILEGDGTTSCNRRKAAFDNARLDSPLRELIDKIASHPRDITDEDLTAVRESGVSEDEIFELVVCAAVGAAVRQHDSALRALDAAAPKKD